MIAVGYAVSVNSSCIALFVAQSDLKCEEHEPDAQLTTTDFSCFRTLQPYPNKVT